MTIEVKSMREDSLLKEIYQAEQILGIALNYPWYCEDPDNFPGAVRENGVCTGEHTIVTLAMEAALRIGKLEGEVENQGRTISGDRKPS